MKYKVEDVWASKLEQELNDWLSKGWEFVTIVRPKGLHYTVLLKHK